jgi:hypothetical protein
MDVATWLCGLGLERYAQAFRDRNPGLAESIGGSTMKLRSLSARRISVLMFSLGVFGL